MNFKILQRILIVIGVSFVMFIELIMTSNKLYVLDQMLPYEVIYSAIIIGIVGCVFYILDKTYLRYLVFYPPILLAILFILR